MSVACLSEGLKDLGHLNPAFPSEACLHAEAVGPKNGECKGAVFHKKGSELTIKDATGCGLDGFEYSVQYCSDQDAIVVHLITPMKIDVALSRAATCA